MPFLTKNQNYIPTTEELNSAVKEYLEEHDELDINKLRAHIMQTHETWRIPERRIRKFVKKQAKALGYTSGTASVASSYIDDDDDVSVSSYSSRVKSVFKTASRRMFGSTTATTESTTTTTDELKEQAPVAAPRSENGTTSAIPLLPPLIDKKNSIDEDEELLIEKKNNVDEDEELFTEPPETAAATPATNIVQEDPVKEDIGNRDLLTGEQEVYNDDNDGKKEKKCVPCEGCIVM